jgi:hypothetical protein
MVFSPFLSVSVVGEVCEASETDQILVADFFSGSGCDELLYGLGKPFDLVFLAGGSVVFVDLIVATIGDPVALHCYRPRVRNSVALDYMDEIDVVDCKLHHDVASF